jgi:signal transduction histidine kinase
VGVRERAGDLRIAPPSPFAPDGSGTSGAVSALTINRDEATAASEESDTVEPPYPGADGEDELEGHLDIRDVLARELHDSVTTQLTTMLVEMEQFKRQGGNGFFLEELERYQDVVRGVIGEARRILGGLRGEPLDVAGFVDSLGLMLEQFQARTGISARLAAADSWPSRLASRAAHELLRIVAEALHNVRMHSAANTVAVYLSCSGGEAILTITDDGIGHDPVDDRGGMGVVGMRERAALVGGNLLIQSAPGEGTTVQAVFPLARLI